MQDPCIEVEKGSLAPSSGSVTFPSVHPAASELKICLWTLYLLSSWT